MSGIAERTLTAVDVDGSEFDMTIRIGHPRPAETDWVCPVSITRLFEPTRDLAGIDSWQALQSCLQFSARILEGFTERGGQLFWHQSKEPIRLSELFLVSSTGKDPHV